MVNPLISYGIRRSIRFCSRLLDAFDSALDFHILYYYLVTNFMNPLAIGTIVWCVCMLFFGRSTSER